MARKIFKVKFTYDVNVIFQVEAVVISTGKNTTITVIKVKVIIKYNK
ncbi:hypothetical protein [Clostridium gelidum]|nr:hypothetical protein [Clostridium gelidum]